MSATQQTTRVGALPKRKRKVPANFADQDFQGSYDRNKNAENTEAAKYILAAAQVPEVEKTPTFVGFA